MILIYHKIRIKTQIMDVLMIILQIVGPLLGIFIVFHRPILEWLLLPHREPDFEHRLWQYWFDEKIAYGKLVRRKRVFKLQLINGLLFEDHGANNKFMEMFGGPPCLDMEVQQAYKLHVYKKFEEVVLGSEAD